jgi:ATP-dependent exoDNAse (exonuclease V) beta subunit
VASLVSPFQACRPPLFKAVPSPAPLSHLLISASAGAGKTYQLVRRYVHLLALGESAEGIAAMTFTRKAAGEFFNRILQRLAVLAANPSTAEEYLKDAEPPLPRAPDFTAILRQTTRRMHRLRLGTMDSFFGNMAACFPLELGLPAGARVMDENEETAARREALEALLERLFVEEAEEAQSILLEAYKQATFGAEEKSVDESLQEWAHSGLALWEECGAGAVEAWGNIHRIWPQDAPARRPLKPVPDLLEDLQTAFAPTSKSGIKYLEELMHLAPVTMPGIKPERRIEFFLEKCREHWDDLCAGSATIHWGSAMKVSGPAATAFVRLAEALMAREFLVRAERTRGLAHLMRMFAAEYETRVRSRGRLSFADVQRLLCAAACGDSPVVPADDELWFRMDARHQHWLLDEFQDTSRVQWQVLSGMVDEVIQDEEGDRSFFAVGDPKQSIYLWRQAEPGLFADVLKSYPRRGPRGLRQEPLYQSYRSAQPVLDAVNQVFGDNQRLDALLPPGSLEGFSFQPHRAVHQKLTGYAALLSPAKGAEGEEDPDTVDVTADLLQQIDPLKRGLSCAVLVRQNTAAQAITEALRQMTGMDVVCESDQHPCTDNAVTLTLISLLTLAAHPGDSQALEHLRMSPLWEQVETGDHSWRYEVAITQSLIFERGFASFVEAWTPRIHAAAPDLDGFHTRRLSQMADIAAEFDLTGERDIDAFLEFAREYPLRTRGARRAIQVMTIHAAKGLEFDIVILPRLNEKPMNEVRQQELLVSRDGKGGVNWVLQTPLKCYARLDRTLSAELAEAERRGTFESLCRLYVAMTRAKRGLYMVADPAPANAVALKECRFLRETLRVAAQRPVEAPNLRALLEWETGARDWFEEAPPTVTPPQKPAPAHAPLGPILRTSQPMPRRRTPSGEETFRLAGKVLFSEGRESGRRLGTLVHAMLAEVEFLSSTTVTDLQQVWRARGLLQEGDEPERQALDQVLCVLQNDDCKRAFEPNAPITNVWRERPFDLMLNGEWVSGVFDRVMLTRGKDGNVQDAWVIDFKTDDVSTPDALAAKIEGYLPQLDLYRQTLSRLAGIPARRIRTSLLFTRAARLVDAE